jgi:PAS domain S-box-containing protein
VLVAGIIFAVILVPVWWQSTTWLEGRFVADEKLAAQESLMIVGESIFSEANRESTGIRWIDRAVQQDPGTSDYYGLLVSAYRNIPKNDSHIESMSLKPKGNDDVVVLEVGHGRTDTGDAFVIKNPLFVNAEYWGLASVGLDGTQVLAESLEKNGYAGMYDVAVLDGNNTLLFGDQKILALDPVVRTLGLPNGAELKIAGLPHHGWAAAVKDRVDFFRWFGFFIIALMSLLVALVVYRQVSLYIQVREHRKSLQETLGRLSLEQARHHQADLENETSRVKFFTLFNRASDVIALCGTDESGSPGRFLEVNDSMCRLLGFGRTEMLGHFFGDPEIFFAYDTVRSAVSAGLSRDGNATFEIECKNKSGTCIPFEFNIHRFTVNQSSLILAMGRDISERKKTECALRSSLAEQDILLKELHHRVKNNLQVIISLIDLQSVSLSDCTERQRFLDCENRIRSMALVHETLYHSQTFTALCARDYFPALFRHLVSAYCPDDTIVTCLDIDDVKLDPDTATSCGFIVNELVTNTFRHAFAGKCGGTLMISLKQGQDHSFILSVIDNGIGLPENIDVENAESLGMQIISAFTVQLHGTLEVSRNNGTTIRVHFSIRQNGGSP